MIIGSNLKQIRITAGLTQAEFGKLFNASRGMIDTYENDRSIPSHDFITRVANHFNLSLDILTAKDLKLNPGYIIQGGELQRQEATKDEIIKMLKKQVRDLQTTVDQQNRIIEKLASK